MSLFPVVLLGIAVSFDGFGVGFAFGLRKLRIPLLSLLIVCGFSAASVFASMQAGNAVSRLLRPAVASGIGGIILILVGAWLIRQALQDKTAPPEKTAGEVNKCGLPALSVVLREPSLADGDNSGSISAREAILLGVTLALDALGAGFGAAMIGLSPAAAALAVAAGKFMFVSAGLFLGKRYAEDSGEKRTAVLSGMVLLILGLVHLSRSLLSG